MKNNLQIKSEVNLCLRKKILHIITSLGDGNEVLYRLISETNKIVHHEVIVLSKDNK